MKIRAFNIIITLGLITVFVLACSGPNSANQNGKPVANITSPTLNSTLVWGEEVLITFSVADVEGVARVELVINGQIVMSEAIDPPVNSYTASHRWLPDSTGNQIIELRAFNVKNVANDVIQHFVTVSEALAEVEATPTVIPAATNTPTTVIFETATPSPTPTTASTAVSSSSPTATTATTQNVPLVTSLVRLNVRLGPTTDYPVIGVLELNNSALITGRNDSSTWWQIEYQSDRGNRGWVSASSQFSTASNVESIPVVSAPPLETLVTSTPTPDPATPTPTPTPTSDALKPTIYTFTAARYTIVAGESVKLSWDLDNAQVAYLQYDGLEEGVVAPGDKTVSPDKETKYILVAENEHGQTTAEVIIKIGNSNSTPTPAPVYRDGKIRIADGQYVDFDQGLVSDVADVNTDFAWNGTSQQFYPQGGSLGTLLSRPYAEITLADCLAAAYDKPIAGVDGSTQVTGCYRTTAGRYGKFLVSEWDLAANLTIHWQTWNY